LRRKQRNGGGGGGGGGGDNDDHDDGASFSSGSTYYVLPSPGQKIKVVVSVLLCCLTLVWRPSRPLIVLLPAQPPPIMKGLYAEPTSVSASKSTPVLQSHRSNGPYAPSPPLPPQPSRPQKRPLLQRIFHPHFGNSSNANATYTSSSSRRTSRR
jgi:hypothetical protein